MYISDKIIYLQMQKTGSSHITKVLRKLYGGASQGKHEQLEDYESYKDRLIVSSIRNPWDWYVSLWAYGCSDSGGLAKYLTHTPLSEVKHSFRYRDPASIAASLGRLLTGAGRRVDWKRIYSDPANEGHFREWLHLMLGAEGKRMTKEGYAASRIKNTVGFMTYRYLSLAMEFKSWNAEGRQLTGREAVRAYAESHGIVNRIVHTESLNEDLLDVLKTVLLDLEIGDLEAIAKTNVSTHRKYSEYYDEETYALVAERDWYVIERFGYQRF